MDKIRESMLITSKNHSRLTKGKITLNIELKSGYAYKEAIIETMSGTLEKIINVSGNFPTPAVLIATVPTVTICVTLTCFEDNMIINKL